jgi:hypothetical protein
MAYQVNKTDGSILASVADSQLDTVSTDLALIGKNYSGFGEVLNENFVKLLENFANTTRPDRPIRGQLWYDTKDLKLKVYTGTQFSSIGSAIVSRTRPPLLSGDLWYNDIDKQLIYFDGNRDILLGPSFTFAQGKSGIEVGNIIDTTGQTRIVIYLYLARTLLGIFAKDQFTPRDPINGYTGGIQPGFNAADVPGIKFNVTATNSDSLNGIAGTTYLRKDQDSVVAGSVAFRSNNGIKVGTNDQLTLSVDENGRVLFKVKNVTDEFLIKVNPNTRRMFIYCDETIDNESLDAPYIRLGGNVFVDGNLNWSGTANVENINQVSLTISDKNVILAKPSGPPPTNNTADGAGIVVKAATQTTFISSGSSIDGNVLTIGTLIGGTIEPWNMLEGDVLPETYIIRQINPELIGDGSTWEVSKSQTVTNININGLRGDKGIVWTQANNAWNISEDINLPYGKEFKINGVTVLSGTSLGAEITSIPGVRNFGTQEYVDIGTGDPPTPVFRLSNNRIETLITNTNLELRTLGTGNIALINSPRITGLGSPVSDDDAATRGYVDGKVNSRSICFSINLTDSKPDSYIVTQILNNLAPAIENAEGTYARILCTIVNNNQTSVTVNPTLNTQTFVTPSGTGSAVTNVTIGSVTVPAQTVTISRVIKIFRLFSGSWIKQGSDIELP